MLRFTDAAAFNDDVVEFGNFSETDEFFEEITTEGAADAAVLEGDDFFFGFGYSVRVADEVCVDVDAVVC